MRFPARGSDVIGHPSDFGGSGARAMREGENISNGEPIEKAFPRTAVAASVKIGKRIVKKVGEDELSSVTIFLRAVSGREPEFHTVKT